MAALVKYNVIGSPIYPKPKQTASLQLLIFGVTAASILFNSQYLLCSLFVFLFVCFVVGIESITLYLTIAVTLLSSNKLRDSHCSHVVLNIVSLDHG